MTEQPLGEILKAAREKQGLSLYALAKLSGVDRSLLWKLEGGSVSDPRPETLSKVAEALGLSMTDLYTNAGYVTATRLPNLRPYLRAKYGHLPAKKREEVAAYFEQIESEYGSKKPAARKPTSKSPTKPTPKKGGRHGNN